MDLARLPYIWFDPKVALDHVRHDPLDVLLDLATWGFRGIGCAGHRNRWPKQPCRPRMPGCRARGAVQGTVAITYSGGLSIRVLHMSEMANTAVICPFRSREVRCIRWCMGSLMDQRSSMNLGFFHGLIHTDAETPAPMP